MLIMIEFQHNISIICCSVALSVAIWHPIQLYYLPNAPSYKQKFNHFKSFAKKMYSYYIKLIIFKLLKVKNTICQQQTLI